MEKEKLIAYKYEKDGDYTVSDVGRPKREFLRRMSPYEEFLATKRKIHGEYGIELAVKEPCLFDFQERIVKWALRKGRCCMFAGTGLGKTRMQEIYLKHIPGRRLIVAPLAVAGQSVKEGAAIGVPIKQVRQASDVGGDGIYIVNYDRLELMEGIHFDGVVLDESGILKNHTGKYRSYIQERFRNTPYRLACTATPAPNDYVELGTHAEFVGAMTRAEMLATFFVHDGGDTSEWRIKRHAVADFWKWVSSWACVLSHPSDMGFHTPGYDLPELCIHEHLVYVDGDIGGGLFGDAAIAATQLGAVLRASVKERVELTAKLMADYPEDPILIWCNIDAEQDALEKAFPGAASVRGSDSIDAKEDRLVGFAEGKYRVLITKPKIGGYGMNWQHCNRMVFCGVTYSFEQVYQAIRRSWRFGQTRPVHAHMVTCNAQDSVMSSLRIKQEAHSSMVTEMRKFCSMEVM